MTPVEETFRIRLLPESGMKRSPEASTATPPGPNNDAEVALPPSPEKPAVPLPATVVMMPLADTFWIRFARLAMKRFPEASTATPWGKYKDAEVAGPPSPGALVPPPATVVMMPLADTFRIRSLL
jgi:hypothetical protein